MEVFHFSLEEGWDDTSAAVLEELVSGTILFTTVVSYTEDGVPLVNLYRRQQEQVRQSPWGSWHWSCIIYFQTKPEVTIYFIAFMVQYISAKVQQILGQYI